GSRNAGRGPGRLTKEGELAGDFPGRENSQDPLFSTRRSYDAFEKAWFEPVATVAGIPGSKKGVTGIEVTRFGARKQSSRQSLGQAGQYGRGGYGLGGCPRPIPPCTENAGGPPAVPQEGSPRPRQIQ